MFTRCRELKRVRQIEGYWCVEIYSIPSKRWVVQGEYTKRETAEEDLKAW